MKGLYNAINMAIGMFTIIPPFKKVWNEKDARHMMKSYPIIGLIIGFFWYSIGFLLLKFKIPVMISSAILLAVPFILTGFLHLDGFMDVCDALLSRRAREEKIKILKDSRVGAFSVISLVLLFLVQFSAINSIFTLDKNIEILFIIPVISRTVAAYFLLTRPILEESYYVKVYRDGTGILDKLILIIYYVLSVILCIILSGLKGIVLPILMLFISLLLIRNTQKELGGINGDVAGYILVLSEFTALIVLAIV